MIYKLVYGLSADPIHKAHTELVCDAAAALIERGFMVRSVVIIPVYRRNLPKSSRPAPYEDRLAMCQIAARDAAARLSHLGVRVEVSRIEEALAVQTASPNFTLETIAALQSHDPTDGLIFLMSSDLVSGDDPEFGRWHRPAEIAREALVAVALRPGYPPNREFMGRMEASGGRFLLLNELAPSDISAHQIRDRIGAGEDPVKLADAGLLLPAVAEYIQSHGLYTST